DARAHEPADESGEDDLVGPVARPPDLAQPAREHRATDEEGDPEADPERLERERADVDLGLHRNGRLPSGSSRLPGRNARPSPSPARPAETMGSAPPHGRNARPSPSPARPAETMGSAPYR